MGTALSSLVGVGWPSGNYWFCHSRRKRTASRQTNGPTSIFTSNTVGSAVYRSQLQTCICVNIVAHKSCSSRHCRAYCLLYEYDAVPYSKWDVSYWHIMLVVKRTISNVYFRKFVHERVFYVLTILSNVMLQSTWCSRETWWRGSRTVLWLAPGWRWRRTFSNDGRLFLLCSNQKVYYLLASCLSVLNIFICILLSCLSVFFVKKIIYYYVAYIRLLEHFIVAQLNKYNW